MSYFVLSTRSPSDAGLIEMYPPKSPADWKFDEGISLLQEFPKGAAVSFSDNHPDARKLYDFQRNTLDAFIISPRVRQLLESLEITNAEYLPVDIKDHKGEVVGKDYAILNLLGGEDAIDMERGDYKLNSLNPDQIWRIKRLALKPQAIRPEAKMFRCTRRRRLVLIREDVHEAFKKAELTGFRTFQAEGWDGYEI
jgi:hypothetical protein